jgi:cell wall-associated NlpC family hydrolase
MIKIKILVTLLIAALFLSTSQIQDIQVNKPALDQTIDLNEIPKEFGFFEDEDNWEDLAAFSDQADVPAMSSAKAESILRTARRYMGVPYVFGSPSGYTKTFDCSTFTQHVYGLHGIDLPRLSRRQAELGKYVEIKDLLPGDLLFFYWPGRFESNKIVGHVGIYMGKGYMIHSAPDTPATTDGVQIMDMNDKDNPFREFYLGAKRVD